MRKVLIAVILVLALILAGLLGFIWYESTHIFVDDIPYAKNAQQLDLRGQDITPEHFQALHSQLPGCEILWDVPFQGTRYSSDSTSLTLRAVTQEDIAVLEQYFPNLTRIDASGCQDYAMLELLCSRLPQCQVEYAVELGGSAFAAQVTALELQPGEYAFDTLLENLAHLPAVESIHFRDAEMTSEQMTLLAETYPDIAMEYTVEILGREYDLNTTQLDLSGLSAAQIDEIAGKLGVLTALESVELMDASGASTLTMEDVRKLQQSAPTTVFHYTFEFYGHTISTTDQEVILKNIKIKEDNFLQQLRLVLDIMESGRRFVLESRGQYDPMWKKISCEELAQIREDYRDKTKFVWRVYFGKDGSSLTDAQVLRAVYDLEDDNSHDLMYCENVRYLDIGHNEFLDCADFLAGMKDLEVAILSGAPLKSLDPIAQCKNLKFLEIANCIYVPDIDALKECTQLEMLNISFTRLTDISVLKELKLTHLTAVVNKVPNAQLEEFVADHPDCWTVTEGTQPYGVGWRYDENNDPLVWYQRMINAFGYPNPYNNVGWYLPEDFE